MQSASWVSCPVGTQCGQFTNTGTGDSAVFVHDTLCFSGSRIWIFNCTFLSLPVSFLVRAHTQLYAHFQPVCSGLTKGRCKFSRPENWSESPPFEKALGQGCCSPQTTVGARFICSITRKKIKESFQKVSQIWVKRLSSMGIIRLRFQCQAH